MVAADIVFTLPVAGIMLMRACFNLAIAAALVACLMWAGNFVIARGVHEWMPPFALAFWRWVAASAFLLPFGWSALRREWPVIRRNWAYLGAMGIIGVGSFNTLIYIAAQYTTTHQIAIIASTTPIFTLIIAGLFAIEPLSRMKAAGACMALGGALLVITRGDPAIILSQAWNRGDVIVLLAAIIWACWSLGLRFKPEGLSTRAFLATASTIGVLWLLPFYVWEWQVAGPTPFNAQIVGIVLYVGLAASVLAWFCWQYAVETIGAVNTSLIYYTTPLFSAGLAIVILGEGLMWYHLAGFALVFGGIVVSRRL